MPGPAITIVTGRGIAITDKAGAGAPFTVVSSGGIAAQLVTSGGIPVDLGSYVPGGGDVTAPTLSSPTGTQTGSTTATVGVTTNEANGTLYRYVSTSSTPPSAANLKSGSGAVVSGAQAVTTTGAKTASITGLTASTTYYTHWLHRDAAGNDSAIVSTASFTTVAAADVTAPTITSGNPSGSYNAGDTVGGTLTANETVTWSVTGPGAATISGNGTTGVWSMNTATPGSYSFTFIATDTAGNTSSQVVAITVAAVVVAPSNTVAPAVTGTAQSGSLLTTTNGTWANSPTSYAYQWQRDGVNIGGETASTYLLTGTDVGAVVRCVVTATNAGGSTSANSNATATVVAASGLTAPDVTVTSAAGAVPEVDIGLKSDHYANDFLDIQRAANTSSDFTSLTMDISYQITLSDLSDGISIAELIVEGYTDPVGPFSQRYRIRRPDGVVSSWVTITGTVTASTAKLSTATGTNKHSAVAVSGGDLTMTATDINSFQGVRATIAGATDGQFEVTLTTLRAGSALGIGIDNGTTAFSTPGVLPGKNNSAGISAEFHQTGGSTLFRNSGASGALTGGVPLSGDVYTFVYRGSIDQIKVYRTRSGTTTLMGTHAWSPDAFSTMFIAVRKNDIATVNFGGSAWVYDDGVGSYG